MRFIPDYPIKVYVFNYFTDLYIVMKMGEEKFGDIEANTIPKMSRLNFCILSTHEHKIYQFNNFAQMLYELKKDYGRHFEYNNKENCWIVGNLKLYEKGDLQLL